MKKTLYTCLTAILMTGFLVGCGTVENEDVGMVAGGVIGGVVGSAVTDGSTAGTVAGAVGGGYLGRQIAKDQ